MIGTGSSAIQSIPIIAEQAGAPLRVPAHARTTRSRRTTGRSTPTRRREVKADYAGFRARNRHHAGGVRASLRRGNDRLGRSQVDAEEREREFEERWQHGGFAFLGAFSDLLLDREANEHARRVRARQDPRRSSTTPTVAELLVAEDRHRLQAPVRRHRLLRDLQPAATCTLVDVSDDADRARSPPHGLQRRRPASTSSTHRVRHRLRRDDRRRCSRIDIRGRDGLLAPRRMGGGPAHLPRPRRRRASRTCSPITGPGSPSVLTNMVVSIEQHVELDRRLHRATCATTGYATHRGHRRGRRTAGSRT